MLNGLSRVVIKLGTNVVIDGSGESPQHDRLHGIAADIATLCQRGLQVVIVSSGAIGLGRRLLKDRAGKSLIDKQVCATVGQTALMELWRTVLTPYQLIPAQLLLTAHDFERRESYLNVHQTLEQLLQIGVIPIINENDATSVSEIREDSELSFGDNDRLSALVAARVEAQLLLILTSTDGIYSANPDSDPTAKQIRLVESLEQLDTISTQGTSTAGRGGMGAKLTAVRIAAQCGVTVQIASGFAPHPVHRAVVDGAGTTIQATRNVPLRKGWIGHSSGYKGTVVVNQGAKEALLFKGSSLLPVGICSIRGEFSRLDVVQIEDEAGNQIGRGLSTFSAAELNSVIGKKSAEVLATLASYRDIGKNTEAIHRDNLVLFLGEDDE